MVLVVKTIIGVAFQLAFFAALMLLPIGTTDWPEAIIWLLIFAFIVVPSSFYLLVTRPAALEARMRAGREAQAVADRLAFSLMSLSLVLPVIMAGKDVFDWRLLSPPPPSVQAMGLVIFLLGFVITLLAMLDNEYAAPTVHIQQEAGHKLADSGVYGYVRHPMYLGFLLFTSGTTLWLGSYAAAMFAVVGLVSSSIYRIGVEEATLSEELYGYKEYKERVKTRFLPFIY